MADFDFSFQPSIEREQIGSLPPELLSLLARKPVAAATLVRSCSRKRDGSPTLGELTAAVGGRAGNIGREEGRMAEEPAAVDLYGKQYGNFATRLYEKIRSATYGEQIGQNGWLTVSEHDVFIDWLGADGRGEQFRVLDVACGSGGPTLRIAEKTGCSVDGVDIHDQAVERAREAAAERGLVRRARFHRVDASGALPFDGETFDAVICIDAINHLPDRAAVLREWHRVLKPGASLVFTDPIVVTGPLTGREVAVRASIGFFLFVPDGYDDAVLDEGGFDLEHRLDCTDNMAEMAARFRDARAEHETKLRDIEGDGAYQGQQEFFDVTSRLARERRLSRIAYGARRRRGSRAAVSRRIG